MHGGITKTQGLGKPGPFGQARESATSGPPVDTVIFQKIPAMGASTPIFQPSSKMSRLLFEANPKEGSHSVGFHQPSDGLLNKTTVPKPQEVTKTKTCTRITFQALQCCSVNWWVGQNSVSSLLYLWMCHACESQMHLVQHMPML